MRVEEHADRIVFHNADGAWTVSKRHGHITRFRERDRGRLVVDDVHPDGPDWRAPRAPNDPRFGGLGAFHAHIGRGIEDPNPYFRTRDLGTGMLAERHHGAGVSGTASPSAASEEPDETARYSIAVVLVDEHGPLFRVAYRYTLKPRCVTVVVEVRQIHQPGSGPPAFVKEPKLAASLCPGPEAVTYSKAEVYDRGGELLRTIDLATLPDPWHRTAQVAHDRRCRIRFSGAGDARPFNVVAEAWTGRPVVWKYADDGLDAWARRSNSRARLEPTGKPYCLQGLPANEHGHGTTLTRQWEIAKRRAEPNIGLMLHGWEGGAGPSDCLVCARAFGPPGEAFSTYLCFSYGDGWEV